MLVTDAKSVALYIAVMPQSDRLLNESVSPAIFVLAAGVSSVCLYHTTFVMICLHYVVNKRTFLSLGFIFQGVQYMIEIVGIKRSNHPICWSWYIGMPNRFRLKLALIGRKHDILHHIAFHNSGLPTVRAST